MTPRSRLVSRSPLLLAALAQLQACAPQGVTPSGTDPEFIPWGMAGTSMAAPHVTAAAALLISAGATARQVEPALRATALDLGAEGYDTTFGYGMVQPDEALRHLQSSGR